MKNLKDIKKELENIKADVLSKKQLFLIKGGNVIDGKPKES